jgi:hypothetical protein
VNVAALLAPLLPSNSFVDAEIMHLLPKKCHRGPIYRVLSRFIGDPLDATNAAPTAHLLLEWRAFRRDGRLVARQKVPDKSGQDPINRPSMAFPVKPAAFLPFPLSINELLGSNALACVAFAMQDSRPETTTQASGVATFTKKGFPMVSNSGMTHVRSETAGFPTRLFLPLCIVNSLIWR